MSMTDSKELIARLAELREAATDQQGFAAYALALADAFPAIAATLAADRANIIELNGTIEMDSISAEQREAENTALTARLAEVEGENAELKARLESAK